MENRAEAKNKFTKLLNEVFFNTREQEKWVDSVDPDFISCAEFLMKRYNYVMSKEQWFRTGMILGARYQQWLQQQSIDSGSRPG